MGGGFLNRRGDQVCFNPELESAIATELSHLEPVFAPIIEAAGFSLVRLRLSGLKRRTLQVMAERPDGTMTVEDCAALSEVLSEFIDAEDPVEGEFLLEVSSPGIDRPLTRLMDFERWAGQDAKITLNAPLNGRKRMVGTLRGLKGNDIEIETGGSAVTLPFGAIAEAKLILTDRLIAEDMRRKAKEKK